MVFLEENPTLPRLLRAMVANMSAWEIRQAQAQGAVVCRQRGLTWTDRAILYPRLRRATAGEQLDALLRFYRRQEPLRTVGCWSLTPSRPRDLGAMLAARGFEWGWRPHWMWLDFRNMRAEHPHPPGLRVEVVEGEADWDVDDLPYYSREMAAVRAAIAQLRPRRLWQFAAYLEDRVVGHSTLNLTTGQLGLAGIFDVGVVPAARNRGIGKAVTLAACRFAQNLGCRHAVLNATDVGVPVYQSVGFRSLGYGQTWWLHVETLQADPPTEWQVALAEAVGRGDVRALEALGGQRTTAEWDAPLAGGWTAIQLAVRAGQPAAAEWLAAHGATLDALSAWELGWKERVPRLLAETPGLSNLRLGRETRTPLHAAAMRNDTELARVVLAARPDLSIDDGDAGTPLHQAAWCGHIEVVRLLLEHDPPLEILNRYGGTPLSTALHGSLHCRNPQGDYAAVVESLIAAGAKAPDRIGGSAEVAEALRRHGVKD